MGPTAILRRRILKGLGYTVFTVAVFLLSLWWLLPYPELALSLERQLAAQGVAARIEGLGPGTFPGVRARKVRVAPGENPAWGIDLHDARVGAPLLGLLRAKPTIELAALSLGGELTAQVSLARASRAALAWQDVDLSRLRPPPGAWELPLSGRFSGQVDAVLQPDATQTSGRAELVFQGARIGTGTAWGFPVPEVGLGTGRVRLSADGGKLEVESAVFEDGDLGVELSGSVLLRADAARSLVNGLLSLRPDERLSRELGLLFAMFPGARGSDGRYTARIRGTLGAPRLLAR
ncbi:MAG: type II secretion system protein GspN [Thermodesulfobacteriota bacterium]